MQRSSSWDTAAIVAADKRHVWHPFTPMARWCAPEHQPLVLVRGEGVYLWDSDGNKYIDGNSSIWTNIHGHNHPYINAAIKRQLDQVAHTSFLGFTNPAAVQLAERLVSLFPADTLTRVFFSDDGSTAMEVALRIVEQHWRLKGSHRTQFVAFRGGYHGDTAGAASLGAARMFTPAPSGWNFPARQMDTLAALESMCAAEAADVAAVVIEPLVQGAAGMKLWPHGTLAAVRNWCNRTGALLITDEVLTGFGRTGKMFACEHEEVVPDLLILGKGLTAGYLPLAATLVTEKVFQPFSTSPGNHSTLFYGHSYAGNALGCSAALANLDLFEDGIILNQLNEKISHLKVELEKVNELPQVAEVRQCGFLAAIVLHARRSGSEEAVDSAGRDVCERARAFGLLTRPIGDVVVLMLPLSSTVEDITNAAVAIYAAISARSTKGINPDS